MSLKRYHEKRDFNKTPEPKGQLDFTHHHLFVIQKHAASHLHYDFRLELNGVLKSWAVPKGPCFDSKVKRLAMHVEDHPVEYGTFEGIIPKGQYGGGTVMLWDKGVWEPLDENPTAAYKKGHLRFNLHAKKLKGRWDLIRLKDEKSWFLIKYDDKYVKPFPEFDITLKKPKSVSTARTMEKITKDAETFWTREQGKIERVPQLPKSKMPSFFKPQLATLVSTPPEGDDWLHEIKFDGYRILAIKYGKKITLLSRNNKDWTEHFPNVVNALQKLPLKNAIFDGEIVLLDEHQRSNFQLLQNTISTDSNAPFVYFIFDLPYYDHWDLRTLPLIERKHYLSMVLQGQTDVLRYSDHVIGLGQKMFKKSCEFSLEGIISKQVNSLYISKRSAQWLKVKCLKRQEFVIGGYTPPQGSRQFFGSLYLGFYNNNQELKFAGSVGTGFTDASLIDLHKKMEKIITKKNPFASSPPGVKTAIWVKPTLVVEVEFSEWTKEGRLRHPSFKGIRNDKAPSSIIKENEMPIKGLKSKQKKTESPSIALSHPDKILYKEGSISKKDVYQYYEQISHYILPFIKDRLITLVRCPSTYQECFFQKKLAHPIEHLHTFSPTDKQDKDLEGYIYLNDLEGLLTLVQIGALEIHPWGSVINNPNNPDVLIFDLDPGPGVLWKKVVAGAFLIKDYFTQLGLKSFVKTTGGKGLHVVIPITPQHHWDQIKAFSHAFVAFLEESNPNDYISNMAKSKRKNKIFIDYLRNQRGATAIAPYSTRARLRAPVAVPLFWEELTSNRKDCAFNIQSLPKRLNELKEDPWKNFFTIKQSLKLTDS